MPKASRLYYPPTSTICILCDALIVVLSVDIWLYIRVWLKLPNSGIVRCLRFPLPMIPIQQAHNRSLADNTQSNIPFEHTQKSNYRIRLEESIHNWKNGHGGSHFDTPSHRKYLHSKARRHIVWFYLLLTITFVAWHK